MRSSTDNRHEMSRGSSRRVRLGWRVLLLATAFCVIAAACGTTEDKGVGTATGGEVEETSSTTEVQTTTTQAAEPDTDDSDDEDNTDDDSQDGSGSDTTVSLPPGAGEEELPGEPLELFVDLGDVLGVVGVSDDDTLNVREKPGTDQEILTTVGPTADDLVGTGRARSLPDSIWYEVSVGGVIGWVSSSFVAFLGGTDDATAELLASAEAPVAETMTDLGRLVAEEFASEEPPSKIVQTVGPTVGDLGEVTYDVVGLGDDAVLGYRLHVFATPDENGETFTMRNVERTLLCTRGLAGEVCT